MFRKLDTEGDPFSKKKHGCTESEQQDNPAEEGAFDH